MAYLSFNQLEEELARFVVENEDNDMGIPVTLRFAENTFIEGISLNKDFSVKVTMTEHKGHVFFRHKVGTQYYWNLNAIPHRSLLEYEINHLYKKLNEIPVGQNTQTDVLRDLFMSINLNERKTIVFTFTERVYLPAYSLEPSDVFAIDVSVLRLSKDKGRTWKSCCVFYSKGKNSKTFYEPFYFPLDRCKEWAFKEDYKFIKRKNDLESINDVFEVKIESSRSKEIKSIVINSTDNIDSLKSDSSFPLLLVLKFDKIKTRNHDCCLVCGTPLRNKNQLYVHLLDNGALTKNPRIKVENHFQYFPVGSECKDFVPEEYLFDMDYLRKVNSYN